MPATLWSGMLLTLSSLASEVRKASARRTHASRTVEDDMNKEDRRTLERIMNEPVLSTSRHPDVYYESRESRVLKLGEASYAIELMGKLTLNGVTLVQNVRSQVTLGAYNSVFGQSQERPSHVHDRKES